MRHAVLTAALLVAAASTAVAQPAMTSPRYEPAQPSAPEVKSGSTATLLAIGTTIGGFAVVNLGARNGNDSMIMGGIMMSLIGPSVGHFYAGETGHGVKMSLLRTGSALVLGMGLVAGMNTADVASCDDCSAQPHDHDDNNTAKRMVWVGAGTLVAATLYDLWDAHRAAGRANEKAARRWNLGPSLMTSASGSTAPALTLSGNW
ncbi:MAG: hypothetical protein H0T46_01640 [Deltaproteobacteria bacterium]|nr:hypothetical protein [Deltaproteobacteria bacterium]